MATIETFALPSRLYRYRRIDDDAQPKDVLDRELKAIAEAYIYCPTYSKMNDPMEGLHRETRKLRDHTGHDKIITNIRLALNKLGIASFSESHKTEPMWAYYTGDFHGICIAYSFSKLRKNLTEEHQFTRMLYTEDAPILGTSRVSPDYRAKVLLSSKNLKWRHEREWRLIRPTVGEARYRDPSCVLGVYLGARMSDEIRRYVVDYLHPYHIPIYSMKINTYETAFQRMTTPA